MNRLSYQIKTVSKEQRLEFLKNLLAVGILWHGESRWVYPSDIERHFPFASWPIINIETRRSFMSGNKSIVSYSVILPANGDSINWVCDTFKRMKTGEII